MFCDSPILFCATVAILRVKYVAFALLEEGRKHLFLDCTTVLPGHITSL